MNRIQLELALGPDTGWKDAYARPERNRDLVSAPPDVIPPAAKGCLQNVIVDLRDVDPGRMQEVAAGIVYRAAGVEVRGESLLDCPEILRALEIDPSIFVPSEKEVVEDLILAAIKEAQRAAEEKMQAEMGKMTEGLGLPAGMKMPF